MSTGEGVRAELREADAIDKLAREARKRIIDEQDGWPFDTTNDAIEVGWEDGYRAGLAERDALAEQVAQAEQSLADVRRFRDEMQDIAGAAVAAKASAYLDNDNLRAALARAEQREARVRELADDFEHRAEKVPGIGAVTMAAQEAWLTAAGLVAAALNEGDTDDR